VAVAAGAFCENFNLGHYQLELLCNIVLMAFLSKSALNMLANELTVVARSVRLRLRRCIFVSIVNYRLVLACKPNYR
jgi:hypothetical protein